MNAYVNDADVGDYVTGYATTLSSYFDRLDLVYAEVFQVLPTELNAEFTTLFAPFSLITDTIPASAADIVAGLDPSTSIDPGIFADLFASIGL